MRKNYLKDYWLYSVAKAISSLARFIPIRFSIFSGRAIGALVFYFLRKKRSIAYKNLKIAFPKYSCRQINRIAKQTFQNCAQHFVEIFYLPWMGQDYINKHIEFEGLEEVLNTISNKKGVIFLGLHEGSWEVASVVLAQALEKYNYTILARVQGDIPLLNELLNKYRTKRYCNIIALTDNFRPIIEHLKNGFALGMVADHGAHAGIFVDFFGKPALTPTGALKLALKLDTNVVIGFIKSNGAASHKITLTPYNLTRLGDENQDLRINLENVNRKFEEHIKNAPSEYLWFFKRWKYSPQRNILVLSDGKPGHLKQSLTVLDLIKNLPFQIKSDIVEIKFGNNWQKIAFQICALFFSNKCQGCMSCLRRLFNRADYEKLLSCHYDAIVSCGSSLGMLNRLIAFENMAKSVVIMRPGMFSLKRFDLAIVPEHDKVHKFGNTALIKGALSEKGSKNKEQIEKIMKDYNLDNPPMSRPVIGVLLGGSNKYLSLDTDSLEKMFASLDDFVDRYGGSVLVSTSRRTTKDIEQLLKEKSKKRPQYRMLVIANELNPQGSIEAILYLSDMVVVSGDSISMISEAASSDKHTVVFKLKRKIPYFLTKYERFIERLREGGYVYVCNNNLSNSLTHIWKYNPLMKKINDREIILDRLREIL